MEIASIKSIARVFLRAGRGMFVQNCEDSYGEIRDLDRRISFLESKDAISLNERKELAILELARVIEFRKIGQDLISEGR